MEKKTGNERDAPISIRIPRHLRETFLRGWQASGYSKNGYILKCIFGANAPRAARTQHAEKQTLAHLLGRSAAIRDALDDAAHRTGDDAEASEAIKAACDELTVIRVALLRLMEREA
ncbi:MAG: hypothetical protein GC201_13240 [Alphaproteobacteria bacterium]|nr:hypothetical protein [Alphaproteobacteria bacterium]